MIKANLVTAREVAVMVKGGDTVRTVGTALVSASENILKALEKDFIEIRYPCDMTLLHLCGQSDREDSTQHLVHEGMIKRTIGLHWGLQLRWMEMIAGNQVEAYCPPQGQIAQLYHSMVCGLSGKMSEVGPGTFIGPRYEGGKMNDRTRPLEDIIDIMEYRGEEYMPYREILIDVCIIRGTVCDEMGNLTTAKEAMKLEALPTVLVAKRYDGKVIAQVKHVAQTGTLNPKDVIVPGVFIDAIVVCDNPWEDHRQASFWYPDPSCCGQLRVPQDNIEPALFNGRKLIARKGIVELYPGAVINLGTGILNDTVGKVCSEERVLEDVMITVKLGIYGGVQAGGIDFGIRQSLHTMIGHHEQADYYNDAGVDVTHIGLGELNEMGNVNPIKMGPRYIGAGGSIDITQNAKKVVFFGTFTAGEARYRFGNGRSVILEEGRIRKMVRQVIQISLNGPLAREKRQPVLIITERVVFKLREEGVVLMEIAPGIDLKMQVLDMMDFKLIISRDLKEVGKRLSVQDGPSSPKEQMIQC